jgi:hypothetical protein
VWFQNPASSMRASKGASSAPASRAGILLAQGGAQRSHEVAKPPWILLVLGIPPVGGLIQREARRRAVGGQAGQHVARESDRRGSCRHESLSPQRCAPPVRGTPRLGAAASSGDRGASASSCAVSPHGACSEPRRGAARVSPRGPPRAPLRLSRVPWIGSNPVTALSLQRPREPPPPAPPPQVGAGSADPPSTGAADARADVMSFAAYVGNSISPMLRRILTPCPHSWGRGRGWGLSVTVETTRIQVHAAETTDPCCALSPQ